MGNFLEVPITTKETDVGDDASQTAHTQPHADTTTPINHAQPNTNLTYAVSAMQGWRAQMEDDHLHVLGYANQPDLALFGVFDGHGGDMVAHYTAKHLPDHLLRAGAKSLAAADDDFVQRATKAFETGLMALDAEMLQLPAVQSGEDQSGSTSVVVLVSARHIVCANTGDSRAVLARGGVALALSNDHKPFLPQERTRIEAAGHRVAQDRVNGDLAVSRALGDFGYKRAEHVPAEAQAVTAFPETISFERDPTNDEFIIIACDGIWDVMSSQDAVDAVRDMLKNGRPARPPPPPRDADEDPDAPKAPPEEVRPWDLGALCEELIDRCLHLGSRDNMSVVIVMLQPKLLPKPEE